MSTPAERLAANIKKIRSEHGMSQGDLCRATGLDRAYMSHIESGNKNPTLATIERIAKALEVSIEELMK